MATVTDAVARAQDAAGDIQNLLDALASKLQQGGDTVIRTSNAATGAVYGAGAGAKAGAAAPLDIPPVVKYGGIALLAYLLMKR
jgi:hypothetical protein